ncbi:MAG: hypothetical protein R3C01_12780 [Planctomycetaceae bacterium]
MNRREFLGSGLMIWGATSALGADWLNRSKARQRCGIPCYDYSPHRCSNVMTEITSAGLALVVTPELIDGTNGTVGTPDVKQGLAAKTFQLAARDLTNQHCRLSELTVTIASDGSWVFQCLATQDPSIVGEQMRPQFERYVRNHLHISVRGVGLFPIGESVTDRVVAKPECFQIDLPQLTIEKREQRRIRLTGCTEDIANVYRLVDRVEVDLRYD